MKSFEQMRPNDEYQQVLRQREIDGSSFYQANHSSFVETDCPACGTKGSFSFSKYGFSHNTCPKCSTLFCSPRPVDSLISLYYTTYQAPEIWTHLLLKADRQRKILQYTPRVEKIVKILRLKGHTKGGIALDLVAGSGAFASCLKNTGFFNDVIALDISDSCVTACKNAGLSAQKGTISDIDPGNLDLICMNDLIEHVFAPADQLAECRKALKSGGFIAIATPNGEGFDFKILKEKTKNITPPEHLNYFNPRSMKLLLEKAGFTPIVVETPGILDVEMIRKERESGFPLKASNEYLDYLLGQDAGVLDNFQKFISQNGLSSHMLVIAQKTEEST
ncbi:methyltransferase domain-containing protein [Methanoregula sp.]|jgi:2-polyprenyl-3-methyl-5-hydroxy-6-metoxy-1,4-benzoquinol methylase|uniref:methyltransferase domain-containing protein n=1 Tax=Methanoregula sp. TaxID=2052170 RepID=UPI0025CEE513|nr:methyltransferase domain-containing protein [Methanoregula sp.]